MTLMALWYLYHLDCVVTYVSFFCLTLLVPVFVGAFAIYLEPWHADIFEFLDLRKNHGKVLFSIGCTRFIIIETIFCALFIQNQP